MKRLILFLIMFSGIVFVGCNEATTTDLIEDESGTTNNLIKNEFVTNLRAYKLKITDLIEEEPAFNQKTPKRNEVDTSDDVYETDDFLSVYNTQDNVFYDVHREYFLEDYEDMIDLILSGLMNDESFILGEFLTTNIDYLGMELGAEIYCDYTETGMIIKLDYSYSISLSNRRIYSIIELGYIEEDFYLNCMEYEQKLDTVSCLYEEFIENQGYMTIDFNEAGDYYFEYVDEVDLTILNAFKFENGWNTISITNARDNYFYRYKYDSNMDFLGEEINIYGDHGCDLEYLESNTSVQEIRLEYNLLETTGWTHVMMENDYDFNSACLYNGETKLFTETDVFGYISESYAKLMYYQTIETDELSNEVLRLTQYGLDFAEGAYTLESLDQIRVAAKADMNNYYIWDEIELNDQDFYNKFMTLLPEAFAFRQ